MSNFAHGYALLIGINEHQVPAWALPDVAKDIDALHAVLTHPERCAYPAEQVRVLRGNAATRTAILNSLDWLQAQLTADASGNATAVVYYSGHGWRNEATQPPTYYLIPYDTQRQSTGPKTATALRAEEFAEAVAGLTPQRLLVVLDCCHAAGVDAKDLGAYVPAALPVDLLLADQVTTQGPTTKGLDQLQIGHGRAVLSSSLGSERSYIRPDRAMSIFTYHLIEALTGHAQPQGGATEVLVSDILSHVHRCVPASARTQGQDQHPDYKLTGNFPVALLLGGKGLGAGETAPNPLQSVSASPAATYHATNTGSGAIAQGPGAVAAGERGVAVRGNVTGSTLVTGNRNRIDQSSRVFDQRGQTVHGNQTNIAGDVNTGGGLFNAGPTSAAPSQAAVLAELRNLLTAITQAGQQGILDEETTIDAEAALRKAVAQASKPNPARQTILEHLTQAQALITTVAQNITTATELATAFNAAQNLVRQWLP